MTDEPSGNRSPVGRRKMNGFPRKTQIGRNGGKKKLDVWMGPNTIERKRVKPEKE